jgi:hypothetical protein
MAKRIEKDGKHYRVRRGQLVEIPSEWVGQVTHPQTINKRPSKQIHKLRKIGKRRKNGTVRETNGPRPGSEPLV